MTTLVLLVVAALHAVSCKLLLVQDLMSPALSPAALLSPLPSFTNGTTPEGTVGGSGGGDLHQALGTMLFHRSKMNEYLCHNYLADEILSDLRPLQSRSGEPMEPEGFTPKPTKEGGHEQLLTDPGSTSYREWLEKSAQMKDLYAQAGKETDQGAYETGDVTGYATVQDKGAGYNYPPPVEFSSTGGWGSSGGGGGWKVDGSGGGGGWKVDGGWGGGGGGGWSGSGVEGQGWIENSGSGWGWEEQETGKGLALKDLFDLALTALAFLAFGIFVLNLIMTCFAKTPNMTVLMAATTAAPGARGRDRREAHNHSQLNELAYRVLTSVDKFLELQEDREARKGCMEYILCDNNKYSRALNDRNKLWLPVWSFGMSWMAGRLNGRGLSAMDHIRAAVLGLGGAECRKLYPHCSQSNLKSK
ncbi:uncharacterized protein LOC124358203 [Homalodisca vitripennis]|uniref:uncharacterized protein LOC124358203 n=1 Tax=Homalodisca vitripennis TaxID=197043 RepID=UPI001EEA0257|nr:uncharacterized protein LOC124358203 [Homalodisca vitripennis]